MFGQVGLNFDFSAGALLLLFVLPVVVLFGCLCGGLAIVSDSRSRFAPRILSMVAIAASLLLFYLTRGLDRGFDIGTLLGLTPGLLGVWGLSNELSRPGTRRVVRTNQFSLHVIFRLVLCIAVALGVMAFFDRMAYQTHNARQSFGLVTQAKMILATPVIDANPAAMDMLGLGPDKAIELCNQAIELAPENGEAYNVRATAYEQKGDTARANADRLQATALGYRQPAPSDTEQTDEREPE